MGQDSDVGVDCVQARLFPHGKHATSTYRYNAHSLEMSGQGTTPTPDERCSNGRQHLLLSLLIPWLCAASGGPPTHPKAPTNSDLAACLLASTHSSPPAHPLSHDPHTHLRCPASQSSLPVGRGPRCPSCSAQRDRRCRRTPGKAKGATYTDVGKSRGARHSTRPRAQRFLCRSGTGRKHTGDSRLQTHNKQMHRSKPPHTVMDTEAEVETETKTETDV